MDWLDECLAIGQTFEGRGTSLSSSNTLETRPAPWSRKKPAPPNHAREASRHR